MPVPKLRNMASPLGQQTGRIDFQLLAVASGSGFSALSWACASPDSGLAGSRSPPPIAPSCPSSPQWHLPQNSCPCEGRERQRLDPWGVEEGGRRSMWYPVILARITSSGRYKSPPGPGGLKPPLTAGPHSLLSAHSSGPLQKLPWGSVTGSGSWC